MSPRAILRFEGFTVFAAATAAYFTLGGPLWLLLVLALAPDLSMLGYLRGARLGSHTYNAVHTYVGPVTIAALGLLTATLPAVWVACVWAAHIGADRALGYGLKSPTGFKHTHLSPGQAPVDSGPEPMVDSASAVR